MRSEYNYTDIEEEVKILIMLLSQKFSLSEGDIRRIRETADLQALDNALKTIPLTIRW